MSSLPLAALAATAPTGVILPGAEQILAAAGPWALLVVCVMVVAETGLLVGIALPGDTLLFFAGVLTATGATGVPIGVVLAAVAASAVLGDQLGFLLGRRAGPAILGRMGRTRIGREMVGATDAFFDRFGRIAVIVARFVPVVRTVAPLTAGATGMPYRRFAAVNVASAIVWVVSLLLGGFALGSIPGVATFVTSWLDLVLLGMGAVCVAGVGLHLLQQRIRARRRDGAADAVIDEGPELVGSVGRSRP